MKKITTLILAIAFSLMARAQTNDLTIAFINITAGSLQSGIVNAAFSITNNGSDAIAIGEKLWFGLNVDDINYNFNAMSGAFEYETLTSSLAVGAAKTIYIQFSAQANIPKNVCVVTYGTNLALISYAQYPLTTTWDANFSDNSTCFTYTPFPVSIEELTEMTEKVFFENNQLVYDWTNINQTNEANIKMTNMAGQTILSETVQLNEGRNRLDVNNNLASGLYLVSFQVNGEVSSTKVYVK
jgi:hypothetical protein